MDVIPPGWRGNWNSQVEFPDIQIFKWGVSLYCKTEYVARMRSICCERDENELRMAEVGRSDDGVELTRIAGWLNNLPASDRLRPALCRV